MNVLYALIGALIFFLPGIFLSYLLLSKTEVTKRVMSIILFSTLTSALLGIFLYYFSILSTFNFILISVSLSFALFLLCTQKKERHTEFNKDFLYIILAALIGTLWRLFFIKSINNGSDAYSYSFSFIGKEIPDMGFYTGMAIDHSRFIGSGVFREITELLSLTSFLEIFGTFLYVFLFLGFIYLIFLEFRSRKAAYMGVALMSLGPIELFYSASGYFGHSFSYLALFSLFLLYKKQDASYLAAALLLSTVMVFTYFTSSLVNAIASAGFMIALLAKGLLNKKFEKMKIMAFFAIILISCSVFLFSYDTGAGSSGNAELVTKHVKSISVNKYMDPTFLLLSAIRWQMLFFFLCGLTFVLHIFKKAARKEKIGEDFDLLLCLIPVLIVSLAFLYANYPTRVFDYFAFFGLLVLKIPKKYYKYLFIFSFVFLLLTGYYVMQDKKIFFENSDEEIGAVSWIMASLNETVFCDQQFASLLIEKGYYKVTGAGDGDPLVHSLFYQSNNETFFSAIKSLKERNVSYIAITKRMQEKFILMVDIPQKPLKNINLYEENLKKVYDNGDVKVYLTK